MKHFGKKFWSILLSAIMTVSAVSGPVALAAEEPSADEQEALLEQVIRSVNMEQDDFPEDALLEEASLDDEAVSSVRADYLALMAEEAAQNGAEAYEAEALTESEEGLTVSPEDLMAEMDAIVSEMSSDEMQETALEDSEDDISEERLESFRQARMELEAETPAEQDGDIRELAAANVATAYLINLAKSRGTYNSSSNSYSYRYYTDSTDSSVFGYYVSYNASKDRLSLEMVNITNKGGSSYCSVDFTASLAVPYEGWIMVDNDLTGVVNVYPTSFSSSTKYYSSDFVFYDGYNSKKTTMANLISAGLQLVVRTSHTMLLSKAGYSVGDLKFTRIASPTSKGSAGTGGISSVNTSRSAAFNRLGTLAVQKGKYNSSSNYYELAAFDSFTSEDFRYEYNVVYYVDSDAIALTELAYDRYDPSHFSAFSGLMISSALSSPYMGYVACTYEGIRTEGTFSVYPKTYTVDTEYTARDFVTFTGAASLKQSLAELFTSTLPLILAETQKYLLTPAGLSVSDLGFTSLIGGSSKPSAVPVTGVSLSAEELTIGKGKTATLTATVSPDNATNKTVSWSSSNSAVATVSKGKVKGVAGGTCTITATCGGKSASCAVTVVETITGLKLSSTKLSLAGGQDAELTVAIKGGANATYDLVAVYDSDLMSVIKTDETTFLITAGSRATTGAELKIIDRVTNKSAKCKVAVGLPADIVKTTMKSTDVNLLLGKSATLKAVAAIAGSSVKPINTKVSWYSSDESVAVVSSKGKVTTVGVGECTIYAEAVAGSDDCEPLAFDVTVVPVIKSFTLYDSYGLKFRKYTAQSGETLYLEDYITSNSIVWKAGRPDDGMVSFTYSMKASAGVAELDEETGELLCLGKGKATVTVTLRCGTQKKTAKVTVTIA